MSNQRTELPPPEDGEESDFSSRLKVRLAIAAGLVVLALAAIPILDNLTGKKPDSQDTSSNAGNIVSSAGQAVTPSNASAAIASAPAAAASAAIASQPVAGAPTGPNLSQTPGMNATAPLTPPPAAQAPATTAVGSGGQPTHKNTRAQPINPQSIPLTQSPVATHQAGKAFKQGHAPQPYVGSAVPPTANSYAPPIPPQQAPATASLPARPAGSSVGYNVQLGLFNNLENAQKLIAELKSKGIEVQSETRVHLAPFRTRAEAEQAVAKLRAMGYAPMLGAAGN